MKFNLSQKITGDDGKEYQLSLAGQLDPVAVTQPTTEPTAPAPEPEPAPATVDTIPLSKNDPRFKLNAVWTNGHFARGTLANKKWDDSPGYARGEPCFYWTGEGSDVLTISQALIDCREGPRIAPGSSTNPKATLNILDSFINCVGKDRDHADGMQAYDPGGAGTVTVKRTCFRSYSDAEARAKYGSGFIGSCPFFWADEMEGDVNFEDVV